MLPQQAFDEPARGAIGAIGLRAEDLNLVLRRRHFGSIHVLIWFRRNPNFK